jgi:Tol biopolymer transport system component
MHRRFAFLVIFSLALSGFAYAQKRAFTIEDLYRIKNVSDVHISPEGKSVTYLVTESDLPRAKRTSHIWLMDIDGRNPRQLTNSARGESSPRFSPDGKSLLFISSRDGSSNLYLIPVAGGEARRLTNISTSISDPVWSPDSKWIAFSSDV